MYSYTCKAVICVRIKPKSSGVRRQCRLNSYVKNYHGSNKITTSGHADNICASCKSHGGYTVLSLGHHWATQASLRPGS